MATTTSPPQSPTDSNPPSAVPLPLSLPPPPQPPTSSRRLPAPCWTPEETSALIDCYRDKWYSLGRTNLKATHWQEVADAVTDRCPNASPVAKTAVQCRHKMEKLRKRYRSEIQKLRSLPIPRSRSSSSWVLFKAMDSMEKGPSPPSPPHKLDNPNPNHNHSHSHSHNHINHRETLDNDDFDDDDLYEELRSAAGGGSGSGNTRNLDKLYRNGVSSGGFRIRIPTGVSVAQPGSKFYQKMSNNLESGSLINGGTRLIKERVMLGKREREREVERERERDPIGEMVNAIKVLSDGFVRMEQMKMEMAREIETMRMEMEMKRTEMILESQQRIVEAFAKAVSEKNKKRKLHKGNSNNNINNNNINNDNNNIASPSES